MKAYIITWIIGSVVLIVLLTWCMVAIVVNLENSLKTYNGCRKTGQAVDICLTEESTPHEN